MSEEIPQIILTIGIVTMNRAAQLKEALQSCLLCVLPPNTEFVIIDNASTDNTEQIVHDTLSESGYSYIYHKLHENIGAGRGRNLYFEKARGTYIYGCDDDAVIDYEKNPDFFIRAMQIMDENRQIVTLATQIYDTAWKCNRQAINGPKVSDGIYKCKMFCGGSHFLRKHFFKTEPYLSNKYGYEELPPSLIAADAGKLNVFCPELVAIHKPAVDKWDYNSKENQALLVRECAIPYAIKRMMYPFVVRPVLYAMYKTRCRKHLKERALRHQTKQVVLETLCSYKIDYQIKLKTVIKMYFDFGLSIF